MQSASVDTEGVPTQRFGNEEVKGRPRQTGTRRGRARRPVWLSLAIVALAIGTLVMRNGFDAVLQPPAANQPDRAPDATDITDVPTGQNENDRGNDERSGGLTEIAENVFESPEGLIYGPGSREGHRIDHVLRHAEDAPGRPIHGVFDGNREKILAVLDEAYSIAKQRGPPVEIERNGERTTYTIDMGRRVGYVGGEAGRRNGFPAASHIRMVLEDREVITAFPLNP